MSGPDFNVPTFNVPITAAPHVIAAPTATFQNLDALKSTRPGAYYEFDAKRGFRILGFIALLVTIGGIAAEVASILATSAGMDEAREADWPITSGAFVWHGCESLPDSDAPATPYGGYLSYFYHCTNIVVLMCMVMFQAKFTARPKATYFISVNGFIEAWLGLGLWSRWVGTFQVAMGAAMLVIGFALMASGFTWFWRTLATEYGFTVKDDIFKAQQDAQTAAAAQQQAAPSASQNIAQQAQDVRAKMLGYALPKRKFGAA